MSHMNYKVNIDSINVRIICTTQKEINGFIQKYLISSSVHSIVYNTVQRDIGSTDRKIVNKNRIREYDSILIEDLVTNDVKPITFMYKRFRLSSELKKLHTRGSTTDCIVSLRGLQNYRDSHYKTKHYILQMICKHFKDRVLITRLDIAIDFRPKNTNKTLYFDKFNVTRSNKRYTVNPNEVKDDWETTYLEANHAIYIKQDGESTKVQKQYYSKLYNKQKEARYPYSIIRWEITLNAPKLKALGITSLEKFNKETAKSLAAFIEKCKYIFTYEEEVIAIDRNKLINYLAWFCEFAKGSISYSKAMLNAYKKVSSVNDKTSKVLSSQKSKVQDIAKELGYDREFVGKVLSLKAIDEVKEEDGEVSF